MITPHTTQTHLKEKRTFPRISLILTQFSDHSRHYYFSHYIYIYYLFINRHSPSRRDIMRRLGWVWLLLVLALPKYLVGRFVEEERCTEWTRLNHTNLCDIKLQPAAVNVIFSLFPNWYDDITDTGSITTVRSTDTHPDSLIS